MVKVDKTMAKHLKKKRGGGQINVRLEKNLIEWAHEYAARKNTTLTKIIDEHLRVLRFNDTDVPQI